MTADVCLLAEGTYPYVTGGVSAWTHDLVRRLPDLSFAIVHLAASAGETRVLRYELPPNVTEVVTVGLHGGDEAPDAAAPVDASVWQEIRAYHADLEAGDFGGLAPLVRRLTAGACPSAHQLLYDKGAWDTVRSLAEARAVDAPFVDYFWTWRFTHLPVFRLLHAPIPAARVYHALCTGWAGLAGAIARARTRRPLLLTEHGLYARERRLDVADADWIFTEPRSPVTLGFPATPFFKTLWSRFFQRLSALAYADADVIVTLFEGNRQAQLADGADPRRTLVIGNGVDVDRFASLPHVPDPARFRLALVGRVVPIKDVKTFLRAVRIVADRVPGTTALVVGPLDEDPAYVAECRALADALALGGIVRFTGPLDVRTVYPALDAVVLTSVSEAVPLVILEAMAAGVPVVATDVGACRELLEGRDDADRARGPAGIVTRRADATATADALIALRADPARARRLAQAGRARARASYRAADVAAAYRRLYDRLRRLAAVPA